MKTKLKWKRYKLTKYGLLWWMREFWFVIFCTLLIIALYFQPIITKQNVVEAAESRQIVAMQEYDIPLPIELQYYTQDVCLRYDIDPALVLAMMYVESSYQIGATNGDCVGLLQVSEIWHTERMRSLGGDNLYDPYTNILTAVDYLAELFAEEKGLEWALMTYNGTDEDVKYELMEDGKATEYVHKVLVKWGELQNE